ncbi:MAG: ferredoxin reductase family protein [Candidatus Nanoarchaeia archaeon]
MKTKVILAWTTIFLIGLIPVIMLFTLGPGDYSSPTHTLGQISGLIGMTFFALTFVLSTRAKWIEDIFGGLDKVYPVHAVLGATSFILILLHPLFLVMKYIPENIKLAAKYLIPGGFLSVDFGIFALLGMIILLFITFYSNMKYHKWKISHEFLGIFFILAAAHVLLVRTNVARDYIFTGYYAYAIIVSAIGILAFVYSLLRIKILGRKYRIEKLEFPAPGCTEIILKPIGKGISFNAGQFVFVKFKNKNVGGESHPFSIASASGNQNIRVIAKNLGDFTEKMSKLKRGDAVIVEGPYGRFHQEEYADEVWVAGGIGITPFLGIAEELRETKGRGKIDLFYTVKNREEFVHLEELEVAAKNNKNFRVFPWVSEENRYLNVEQMAKKTSLKGKEFFLCGPVSLKAAITNDLRKKGVSKSKIHDERFAFK